MAFAAWRGMADGVIGSLGTLRGAVGTMGGTGTLRGGAVAQVSSGVTRGGTGTLRIGAGIRGSFGARRGGAGGANRSANRRSLADSLAARGAKADPGEGWGRHWRILQRQDWIIVVELAIGIGIFVGNHAKVSEICSR
jgi:hypothetical protein